jgi:5'-phosphate synthase pdxT subunit
VKEGFLVNIGVLALQGDFAEHVQALRRIGVRAVEVRLPAHLEELEGLIIPGGESTTIGKLAEAYGMMEPLRQFGRERAIWGTCAGAIFLAKKVDRAQPVLGLMDIQVSRNAFGRQIDSFETALEVPDLAAVDPECRPFPAVFIRAPIINSVSGSARITASLPDGRIVAARQGRLLVTAFHPELTGDDRFHQLFARLANGNQTDQDLFAAD